MSQRTKDQQMLERVGALYNELKKPIFVLSMAHGRLEALEIEGAPASDPRVRGAHTSVRNAAAKMEAAVLAYQVKHS